jgi:hypothetical protein
MSNKIKINLKAIDTTPIESVEIDANGIMNESVVEDNKEHSRN